MPESNRGTVLEIDRRTRKLLKEPQGRLFGSFEALVGYALDERDGGASLIVVGDRTTLNFLEAGIVPDVAVVDGREKRGDAPYVSREPFEAVLEVRNEPGTVNLEVAEVVEEALSSRPAMVSVRGEEDLAVVAVCAEVPGDLRVFYGQPDEGVVAIDLSAEDAREPFRKIVRSSRLIG